MAGTPTMVQRTLSADADEITYTRDDLGIVTAVVERRPCGALVARLYYGPEPGEYDREFEECPGDAERLALEHSLNF
jgi:hypothetical protein